MKMNWTSMHIGVAIVAISEAKSSTTVIAVEAKIRSRLEATVCCCESNPCRHGMA